MLRLNTLKLLLVAFYGEWIQGTLTLINLNSEAGTLRTSITKLDWMGRYMNISMWMHDLNWKYMRWSHSPRRHMYILCTLYLDRVSTVLFWAYLQHQFVFLFRTRCYDFQHWDNNVIIIISATLALHFLFS